LISVYCSVQEEDAIAAGYTQKQIEDYKISVVAMARENALRALELKKQASAKSEAKKSPSKRPNKERK